MRYEPTHHTVMAMDVAGSGARDDQQILQMRSDLRQIVTWGLAQQSLDLDRVDHDDLGDGLRLFFPADISPALVLDPFVPNLATALRRHRKANTEVARLRLRVAVHMGLLSRDNGAWAGAPLVHCARLLDAEPVRRVLRGAPAVNLVLVMSQAIHDSVVAPGYGPDPAACQRVEFQAKETRATAWIHVPGYPAPPGPAGSSAAEAAPAPVEPSRVDGPAFHVHAHRDAYVARDMTVHQYRSARPGRIRVVVLAATLGVGALTFASSQAARRPADAADVVREMVCTRVSAPVVVQNHHSRLYLVGDGRPRLGSARWRLMMVAVDPNAADCAVRVHPGAERSNECMTVAPDGGVRWSGCENRNTQIWIVEQHWRNAYYEWWEHLRPLSDASVCLQPSSNGGVGTSLTTAPCGEGWLQQWRLTMP